MPTRSVAESILLSQVLSTVRKQQLDIDGCAESMWKKSNSGNDLPPTTSDSPQLYHPMIDSIITAIAAFAAASQEIVHLETALERRKDQLRAHGVAVSPAKPLSGTTSATAPCLSPSCLTSLQFLLTPKHLDQDPA